MPNLEKLIADKQDQLRGRARDWIDDFKDWRQRVDWPIWIWAGVMTVLVIVSYWTI